MKRYFLEKQVLVLLVSLITLNLYQQTFVEQTDINLTGVQDGSAAWGDFDNNGHLDVLLTGNDGSSAVSKIFWNIGDNTFSDLPDVLFIGVYQGSTAIGDCNNDGNPDVLLTGSNISGTKISKIYQNNGDHTFTELSDNPLVGVANGTPAWGDYDNDGDLDILIRGYSSSVYISKIYCNNGENTFTLDKYSVTRKVVLE